MPSRDKSIKCPKCSKTIQLAYSEDANIFIKCDYCGAKGRIKNPYKKPDKPDQVKPGSDSVKGESEIRQPETSIDKEAPEGIDCPRCGCEITIPYSTKAEVMVKCNDCGAKGKVPNPYVEEKGARESAGAESVDVELIECPKCETEIKVPFSDDERVVVQCNDCGAMGRINNPHLLRRELESEEQPLKGVAESTETELESEHSTHGLTETIDCPKCSDPISIPYSTAEKLKIQCDSCGAKGKIPNPYL